MAVLRSRRSIAALMDIRPAYANLVKGDTIEQVNPEEVVPGDIILLKPGERIPLDGQVVAGTSQVDTSALTGESVPLSIKPGDDLISGSINISGVLHMSVSRKYAESTVAKILDLVQNAAGRKAPTEKFISKFARYYTPAVVSMALAIAVIPPLVMPGALFSDWLYRALVFLVVSCPCALVISIPLSFFGGIGAASRNGILVKGGNFLEALNQVDTVVFDKTGTLTKGVFNVTAVIPAEGMSQEKLLEYAAVAESYSHHPIAKSIRDAYKGEVVQDRIQAYEEVAGYGIQSVIEGKTILVGNKKLMAANNVFVQGQDTTETTVHLAIDGGYAGRILISDEIKEDARRGIQGLKDLGIKKLIMLTGDGKDAAGRVAEELALEKVYAELLPHAKVEKMEEIYRAKGKGSLIYVGDGINDAPVIARADVGIAMGGLGSDAAIEAADVVLMTDEPSKLLTAIKIARQTRAIVWQNILFALAVKGIIMALGAFGLAGMWEAVFADVGVTLLAILNAMRLLRARNY
jgi:Zn2+/Cd2+-exporting ATPase